MTTAGIPRGMRTKIQFADYASAAPWNSRSRGATWKRISHLAIATPPPSSHTQLSDITRLFTEKVHPPRYRYLTSVLRFRNGSQPQEKTKIHDLIPRVNTVIRTRVRKVIRIFLDLERKNYVYVRKFQLI